MSLLNKLALITGASSGIGLAVVKLFSEEGAIIIAVDLQENVKTIIENLNESNNQVLKHSAFACDISNSTQVDQMFAKIKIEYPEHKTPSIVVNAAGIYVEKQFLKTTEDMLDRTMDVNFKGSFLVAQAACKELVANYDTVKLETNQSYASIINIASVAAKKTNVGMLQYSASKAAVDSLSRSIAKELGKYKIRCNSVGPGFILTPMVINSGIKSQFDAIKARTPLGRLGESDEIAQVCLFLASDKSSFMTGSFLQCDGGLLC